MERINRGKALAELRGMELGLDIENQLELVNIMFGDELMRKSDRMTVVEAFEEVFGVPVTSAMRHPLAVVAGLGMLHLSDGEEDTSHIGNGIPTLELFTNALEMM